jgi:hypothetical protein
MRNRSLEKGEAAVFGQLGLALLKTIETSELETRLQNLEKRFQQGE